MKKFFIGVGILIGILLVGFVGTYAYLDNFVWNKFFETSSSEEDKQQDELNKMIEKSKGYDSNRPQVFLISGIDTNDVSVGRTDALMLGILDSRDKEVYLVSIPRDLRVYIEGKGYDKINSAYAYGGISLTKSVVSNLFDVPIDNYISVNFNGFKDLVDAIGGVEIYVEKDLRFHDRISDSYFELSEGLQTLNGFQTLNYARFRKDAEGDFGRIRRQQEVVKQIALQTLSLSNVTKMDKIVDALGDNVKTDVNFNKLSSLAVKFIGFDSSDVNSIKLDSYPNMINGVSYVIANDSSIEIVKNAIYSVMKDEEFETVE